MSLDLSVLLEALRWYVKKQKRFSPVFEAEVLYRDRYNFFGVLNSRDIENSCLLDQCVSSCAHINDLVKDSFLIQFQPARRNIGLEYNTLKEVVNLVDCVTECLSHRGYERHKSIFHIYIEPIILETIYRKEEGEEQELRFYIVVAPYDISNRERKEFINNIVENLNDPI